ncbi:MAG: glycosyltransferase family 4 protein [Patescibacteria group bacterium]
MKIAFIGQKGIPAAEGGVERHVEELSARLAALGQEVYVYCRRHYTKFSASQYKGVNLIYLPSVPTKNLDTITHTFLATLDAIRRDFDIIHFQGVGPSTLAFLPRILKSNVKVITTFHCRDQFHQKWGPLARKYLAFGEYAVSKFSHQTICVSKTIKNLVREKFGREAKYIPNGVAVKSGADENIIKQFGLEKDKYLLTCGRLVRHKGIHLLIKAFKRIKNQELRIKDLKLVIVGDSVSTDEYVKELRKLAEGHNNIIFTGFQYGRTLASLFENAYLYIHPSYSEGLPITVLEAMAYGKTVLVSNIPENIEAFAGRGYMFLNKNVNDLAYKIQLLLENPDLVEKTGKTAREYVLQNYNWEKIVAETLDLYKKTLAEAPEGVLEKAKI